MSDSSNNPEQTPVNQASNIPNDDLLKAFDKPQDQYTCINLNNRKIAIAFIDSFLSEYGYFPSLDLSKLKVESRDMHDDVVFKDSRADIRYSIPLVNAPDETSQVVVLAEHKSSRDPWAILQLEHYTSLALYQSSPKYKKRVKTKVEDSEKKNKKKGTRRRLPPVIPIIIYNGKKPYSGPRCLSELYQHVNGMKEPYLEFKPIIIDLRKIPFDELPNNPNEWRLNAVLRALKSGMMEDLDFKEVEKNFQNILEHYNSENPEDVRFLKETIRYYLDGSRVDPKQLISYIKDNDSISEEGVKDMAMTAAQQLIQEGWAEGREEGWAEGDKYGFERGDKYGFERGHMSVLISMLRHKFHRVPMAIQKRIMSIHDGVVLQSLIIEAMECQTLDEFCESLL